MKFKYLFIILSSLSLTILSIIMFSVITDLNILEESSSDKENNSSKEIKDSSKKIEPLISKKAEIITLEKMIIVKNKIGYQEKTDEYKDINSIQIIPAYDKDKDNKPDFIISWEGTYPNIHNYLFTSKDQKLTKIVGINYPGFYLTTPNNLYFFKRLSLKELRESNIVEEDIFSKGIYKFSAKNKWPKEIKLNNSNKINTGVINKKKIAFVDDNYYITTEFKKELEEIQFYKDKKDQEKSSLIEIKNNKQKKLDLPGTDRSNIAVAGNKLAYVSSTFLVIYDLKAKTFIKQDMPKDYFDAGSSFFDSSLSTYDIGTIVNKNGSACVVYVHGEEIPSPGEDYGSDYTTRIFCRSSKTNKTVHFELDRNTFSNREKQIRIVRTVDDTFIIKSTNGYSTTDKPIFIAVSNLDNSLNNKIKVDKIEIPEQYKEYKLLEASPIGKVNNKIKWSLILESNKNTQLAIATE